MLMTQNFDTIWPELSSATTSLKQPPRINILGGRYGRFDCIRIARYCRPYCTDEEEVGCEQTLLLSSAWSRVKGGGGGVNKESFSASLRILDRVRYKRLNGEE